MEETKKPNDMFAAVMQAPDVNVYDLAKSQITPENTQLLNKDFYKSSSVVQEMFKDDKGNFNTLAFDNAYNKAALTFSELSNDQQFAKLLEWDPYDFTAPLNDKHYDVRPGVVKDRNPFKNEYSRTGINSVDASDMSLRELAQAGKVFDTKNNVWLDKSANELSFFDKFLGDTLVYGQYDKDEVSIDTLTGQKQTHKKGDWKFDSEGNLFIEKLGDREIYGKQIVNPMDLLTVDGSAFNKVDFFDSDGKTKSIAGTTAKLVVEIAPFLIPGESYYGAYKMAMGLSYVLPTFYKAIEGILTGDTSAGNETPMWKAMNSTQGYLAKYNQRSTSDEAAGSLLNYEQLSGIVSDIYSQIYEQRAAADLSKLFYKEKELEYISTLNKTAQDQLKVLSVVDDMSKVARTEENYAKIAQRAAAKIGELSEVTKKRSALAKDLNLAYMAMTQSSDMYGEALAGGYDRRTAGAAALMGAAGQFALMRNNPLGDWFLDNTVGYNNEKAGMIKVFKGLRTKIKANYPGIQEALTTMETNKVAGKTKLSSIFTNIKSSFKTFVDESNTMGTNGGNIARNSMIEGIEEVSEQAVLDMSKGVIDFLSYAGLTGKEGSFGGLDVVFSQSGFENYLANFVGGIVGGAMFEAERLVISPLLTTGAISRPTQLDVIDYVSNGKAKEFLEVAKDYSKNYTNTSLSAVATDVDGKKIYLGNDNKMNQADFMYSTIEQYVNNVDRILNSENVNQSNEDWVRKAIIDEVKIQDMQRNNTDSFIISDVKEKLADLVNLKATIEQGAAKGEDTSVQLSKLKQITNELDEIQSGEKADEYYGLSLFALNDKFHKPFLSLSVDSYVATKYKKVYNSLPEAEKKAMDAEFKAIMNGDGQFKNRMKAAFGEFTAQNANFSKALEDYSKGGYDVLRRTIFKELYTNKNLFEQAVKNKDFASLKELWSNISSLNTELSKLGLKTPGLNQPIDIDFGKFLLETGVISLGLSDNEIASILQIESEDIDVNLKAQAILNRLELEGFDLENTTLETLKSKIEDENDLFILLAEKEVLKETILKSAATTVKDTYHPEVFDDIDSSTLSEEEKMQLSTMFNMHVPTMETMEGDLLSKIANTVNNSRRGSSKSLKANRLTAEPTDIEGMQNLDTQISTLGNMKNMRVPTKTEVLNKTAFLNTNADKFYTNLIGALAKANVLIIGQQITFGELDEFNDNWLEQITEHVLDESLDSIAEYKEFTDLSKILLETLKPLEDRVDVLQDQIYDLQDQILDLEQKQLNITFSQEDSDIAAGQIMEWNYNIADIEAQIEKIASKEAIAPILNSVLSNGLNLLLQSDALVPQTRAVAESSKLMMNNVQGQYILSPDFYNTSEQIFTSPTAQLLANFAEAIMAQGGRLDNEIVEALKEELTKINQSAIGELDIHRQGLVKRLENVINYGNVQHNTLLDKLRQIQINLYKENKGVKSAFDLLKELNTSFAQSTSPAEFKLDQNSSQLVDKALYTLDMVRAVMAAMTTTDVSMEATVIPLPEFLYGYNINFNKMYAKQGVATQLGLLLSEDIQLLHEELDKIEGKLQHFKVLSENNSGSIFQEQDKVKTAILSAMLERFTSAKKDSLSLLQLGHNGRFLLTSDDLDKAEKLGLEEKLSYLEDVAKKNFDEMVGGDEKNLVPVLNSIFEQFSKDELKVKSDYTILDNPDSNLTGDMTKLETKDWYVYLHAMLASSSYDFYELYKKYQEKEVSLSENFRAPFFTQQFLMRQAFGYVNGTRGKAVMSHIVSFIVPDFDYGLDVTNASTFPTQFVKNMDESTGLAISNLFFIRGTSGTGKSDILSNFILWVLTDKDSKLLGNTLKITALAPTEKTKLVLEKSINRNINASIDGNTVDTFIENLIPTSSGWVDRINTLKNLTGADYKNNEEMQFTDSATGTTKGSGIFIVNDSAAFTQETLRLMFSSIKNDTPQILIIDEASKINSLQYQVLNYLAQEKNYYIIVLGDDLQEGVILGKTTSSLENIYMPSSVKLKSTIRAENIHKNNNNITLEHWVNSVRNNVFFSGPETKPVILDYAIYNGVLHGEKLSTLSSLTNDLKTLDTTKEIVFITDDGKLSEDQQNLIKAAYGESFIATVKIFSPDVQGEEFDQVVILASLEDTNLTDPNIAKLRTAKKIYTLLSRAKIATIIVGDNKYLTNQQKDISAAKGLNQKEVKEYLDKRFEEITNILKNLEELKPTSAGATQVVPAVVTVADDVMEILDQIVPDTTGEEDITEVPEDVIDNENINEENKIETFTTTQEVKDSIESVLVNDSLDIKIKGYSYYLNLGKTVPDNMDISQLSDWITSIDENSTDFAKYVYLQKDGKYSEDNLKNFPDITLKEFYDDLDQFILVRNEILAKILKETNVSNSNNVIKINDKILGEQTLDLASDFYIKVAKANSYSQPYRQKVQKKLITQTQYFLTVNINGIPVSLLAIADEKTATNEAKNIKGDPDRLRIQYTTLKNSNTGEAPINLVGNIKYLTGVKTVLNDVVDDKIEIDATRISIEESFPGARIESYGAFRGPSFNDDGTLDGNSVNNFMTELEATLNTYNKTPIKVIDINTVEKRKRTKLDKGQVPYQRYMFRPYVILTYNRGNTTFTKLVLLYSKSRGFGEFWNELNNTTLDKSLLVSKYQSWKILEEFLTTNQNTVEEKLDWLLDIFQIGSLFSSSTPGKLHSTELNLQLTSLFINEFKKWDGTNLPEFINNSIVLQKIFKGIHRGFNPLFYINAHMQSIVTQPTGVDKMFADFMETIEDKKIYYNLRIHSLKISGSYGATHGGFTEEHAKNYFMGYYVQPPDVLIDLEGLNSSSTSNVNVVTPSSPPVSNITNTPVEKLAKFNIAASKTFGIFGPSEVILEVDLTQYPVLWQALLEEDATSKFKDYLAFWIPSLITQTFGDEDDMRSLDIDLDLGTPKNQIQTMIKTEFAKRFNYSQKNEAVRFLQTAIINKTYESQTCKIS